MPKKPKRKVGRPSGYKPEYAELAKKVCEIFGSIDSQTADFLGVSLRTFNSWKIQHPEFLHSLKTEKEHPDERVLNSLYHRAIGYSYDAVKIFCHEGKPIKVPYREHVPPDVTACIFWLKNRRPDLWRDKHDMTVAKLPPDNRSIMEQWHDLLRNMEAAGAIEITPDDPAYKLIGVANKPNGDGTKQ